LRDVLNGVLNMHRLSALRQKKRRRTKNSPKWKQNEFHFLSKNFLPRRKLKRKHWARLN